MVMRRSDIKRISKDVSDTLEDNPKRTKVHAQRKFAQGSGMNSPVMTPIKDKEKSKVNGTSSSPELLPSKRPRTEDFLTYLCFRGTEALPPRLDFFNLASKSDKLEKDSSTPGSSKQTAASQQENKVKRVKSKLKNPKIVHSLKNKIHENRLNTRSSRLTPQMTTPLHLRHRQVEERQKKVVNVTKKQLVRGRPAHHPSILKRLGATRLRTGLRSGGQLPPGSDIGIKSDRKPRKKLLRTKSSKNKKEEKTRKNISKGRTNMSKSRNESENEDEEEESVDEGDSDDDESDRNDKQKGEITDEKKEKEAEVDDINSKESRTADEPAAKKTCRISTRSRASSGSPANPPTSLSVSSRPSRKTKEVATLYMEMLTKDLRSPEDEEEEIFVKMPSETGSVTKRSDDSVGSSNFKKHRKSKNNETIKNKAENSNKISLRTRASRRGRMKLRESDKFNREDFRITRGQSGVRQWTRGRPPLRRGRGRPPLTRITSERRILRNVGKFTNFAEDQSETEDEEDEMYVESLIGEEMESSNAKPARSTSVIKTTKTATKNETQNEQDNQNNEKMVNKRRTRSLLNSKVQKSADDSSEEDTRRHTRGSKVKEQIAKERKRLTTRRTRLENSDSEVEKKSDSGKDKNPAKRGRKDSSIERSKDTSEKESSKAVMKAESSNSGRKKGVQEKKDAEDSALKVQSNQTDQSVAYLLLSLAQMQGWKESEADSHCVEENSSAIRSTRSSVKEETKNKRGRKSNTSVDSRVTNEKMEEEKSTTGTARKNKAESLTPEISRSKSKVFKSNSSKMFDAASEDEKNFSAVKSSKSGNVVEKKVSRRESFSNKSKNQDIKTSSDSDEEKSTLGKSIRSVSDGGANNFSKKSGKFKIANRGSELSSESEVDVKLKNETKSKDSSEAKKDLRGKRKSFIFFKKEEESLDGNEIDDPDTKSLPNMKKNGNFTNFETCKSTKSVVTEAMKGNFLKASQKVDDDAFGNDLMKVESVKKVESEVPICRAHSKDFNVVGSEKKRKPVTIRKSSADSNTSQSSTVNCKVLVEPIETVGTFMKKTNEKSKNVKGKGISEKGEDNFASSDESEAMKIENRKTTVKSEISQKNKKLISPSELLSHNRVEYDLSGSEKSQNDLNNQKKIIDEEITTSDESDSESRANKAGKEFIENKDIATNVHKRIPRRARIDYSQGSNRDVRKRTPNARKLKSVNDKYVEEDSYSSDVSSTSEELRITTVKSQKRIKPKNAAQNDAIESAMREAQNAILKQENNESNRINSSLPPNLESHDSESSVNLTPLGLEVKFKNEMINDHSRQTIDFKNFPQLPVSKISENKSSESSGSTQGKERHLDKNIIVHQSNIIERSLDNKFSTAKSTSIKDGDKSLKLDEVSQNTSTVFKMNPSNIVCDSSVKQINVENENKKQSMSETWRQAFKNAKIPKPGQSSPVPHGVKPFVRKPFTSTSLGTKQNEVLKGVNQNLSKISSSLNQFKTSAFQSLGKYSPNRTFSSGEDASKSQSPSRRVIEIRDSPSKSSVSSSEESRIPSLDTKKIEQPTKSLTQLQYEKRSSDLISSLKDAPIIIDPSYTVAPFTSKLKEAVSDAIPQRTSKTTSSNIKPAAEGKHLNLPLAVEHTLRKMSPITVSKKPLLTKNTTHLDKKGLSNISTEKHKEVDEIKDDSIKSGSQIEETTAPRTTNIEILGKKKVNMTTEEIKRWLDDSTSSGIEHAKDCGIFEKNQCECSYRTSGASMLLGRGVAIGESGTDLAVNREMRVASCQLTTNKSSGEFKAVEPVQLRELAEIASKYGGEILTCKVEDYREKEVKNKEVKHKQRRQSFGFKSDRSMTEEEMCEFDFRFDRNSNSPRESGSEMSSPPPLRDDISEKSDPQHSSPSERKPIFQQRRSCGMPLKRPSQSKSPAAAFSAENESSVYAFEPEDPPVSVLDKPFRRRSSKGTRDEEVLSHSAQQTPSSSIAVQVNLESEAVLETEAVLECCTTQTEHSQDDEENGGGGRSFYIPIEQSNNQLTPQQTIKGVTLKVESEGPNNQRVMLRAKLVTKPPSTFATPSTSHRLVETTSENGGNSSGSGSSRRRPEQKVRPLSARAPPPVGTVQPTLREAIEQTTISGSSAKLDKPRQASQGTQSSPLPVSANSSNLTESSESVRIIKGGKHSVGKVGANPIPEVESSHFSKTTRSGTATMVEAPTFYPTEKEFGDPLEYIEKITPLAQQHGICRIVPPPSFKPECKVSDDMRFTAYNQYIHKMLYRWGPNVREMSAIRKYLATQNIALNQPPWIGGMEVDLPRLYQTVQQCGGLKEVYEKKRWTKVADVMKIPRSSQDRVTKLDDIYCKFLLPYDTLSHSERSKLLEEVEIEWREREKRMLEEDDESVEKEDGSDNESDTDDRDECITKGKSVALSGFYRIARNTMSMWFSKDSTPGPVEVENEFWRHVTSGNAHVCVHSGSIDTATWGCGFPTGKERSSARHPWNLKILTNNPRSILRSLGPVIGVTVPTLHVGMLYSACSLYRDPHALPWIEYLHTGANKIWYGVPDSWSEELKRAVKRLMPRYCREKKKIWLASDTVMVPPQLLVEHDVSVCRTVQEPGQFVVVFPRAFTSSLCTGYLVSESVYFALASWLDTSRSVFRDIQDSCEPPIFSLEKLLFNIATDIRSSAEVLTQILPMVIELRDEEVSRRKVLEGFGLVADEKLPVTKGRRTKSQEEPNEYECEICRGNLFLSLVTNTQDEINYCLVHAIDVITKDKDLLKHCKLMYAYDEEEMEELIGKIKTKIEIKSHKKGKSCGTSSNSKN